MGSMMSKLLAGLVTATLVLNAGSAFAAAAKKPPEKGAAKAPLGAKKSSKLQSPENRLRPNQGNQVGRTAPTLSLTPEQQKAKDRAESRIETLKNGPARPDHLIIKYKQGIRPSEISSLNSTYKMTTVKQFQNGAQLVRLPNGADVKATMTTLRRSGQVEFAEPDYKVFADNAVTPNDPLYGSLWGMNNTGANLSWYPGQPDIDINAPEAWWVTQGDANLVVAVLDTGIDLNHPDLVDRIWTNPGEVCGNGVDDDANGYIDDCNGWDFFNLDNTLFDPFDGDLHGTHVAGTIAATMNNALGVAGVAPNVQIMPLKFIGPEGGYISDAILAVEYAAAKGVKLSNNSWGGGGYSEAMRLAIENSGMLFVAAAGNSSLDNDINPEYPASYASQNVLSVASTDSSGDLSWFSNYGATSVDVAAPGENILSSIPMLASFGGAIEKGGQSMFWGFGVEDLDAASGKALVETALGAIGVQTADSLLVVLDDHADAGFPSVQPELTSALNSFTNVTFQTVSAAESGPTLDAATHKAVLWATGKAWGDTESNWANLTDADQANIIAYLNAGGKFFLMGEDAIYNMDWTALVRDHLGVRLIADGESRNQLTGEANTPFAGTIVDFVMGSVYRDQVEPISGSGAAKVLSWTPADVNYDNAYGFLNGTSMATPHVTGAAALVLSQHPDWAAWQVKDQLMLTARPLASLNGLVASGGMVDAHAAIALAEPDNEIPGVPYPGWGQTVTGTLNGVTWSDLDDVFSLSLNPGEELTVQLDGAPNTDFDLYIYGPNATSVNNIDAIVAGSENVGSQESITYVAPAAGQYYIDAFAYQGEGSYSLTANWGFGVGCYEEDSPALRFDPTGWSSLSDPAASGGAYQSTRSAGAGADFSFRGDTVEIFGVKGPDMGMARIWIDGTAYEADLWTAGLQPNASLLLKSGLAREQEHQVRFESMGLRSPYGKRTAVTVALDRICVTNDTTAPAAPAELSATAYDGGVDLSWPMTNTEADLAGFNIYRADTAGGPYVMINPAPIPPLSQSAAANPKVEENRVRSRALAGTAVTTIWFWDGGVVNGQDYYYVVRAADLSGNESTDSPEATAHPDAAPADVQGLGAVNGDGKVTVHWNQNADADLADYILYRTDLWGALASFTVPPVAVDSVVTFEDTTVTNETQYQYSVYARDVYGITSWTAPSVYANPSAPPSTPTGLTGQYYGATINLSWNPNPEDDISTYEVFWLDYLGNWQFLTQTASPPVSPEPPPSNTYGVQAVDYYGLRSGMAQVTINMPTPPAPPTNLTGTRGTGQVTLNWTPSTSTVTKYRIYKDGGMVTDVNAPATSYTVTGLDAGISYDFVVKAWNASLKESEPSNTLTIAPLSAPPTAPTGLQAAAGDGHATLSWTASTDDAGVTGYEVYVGTGSTEPTDWTLQETVTGTTYDHLGLTNGTIYWYKVRAMDADGNVSGDSNVVYAMPNSGAVGAGTWDNTSADIRYAGSWMTLSATAHHDGSASYTYGTGASAELVFTGSTVRWMTYTNTKQSIADVYIDGMLVGTVDLYSPTTKYQTIVFEQTGLGAGVHTLKLVHTGTRNPASTGTSITLDALIVLP